MQAIKHKGVPRRDEGYLKPVAIQLIVDPQDPKGTVYTPNDHTELWTLAKAVFGNLDFLYHQAASVSPLRAAGCYLAPFSVKGCILSAGSVPV